MRRPSARVSAALVFVAALSLLLASAPGRGHFLADDDHGFQLSLGYQVLHGKVPGVDVFNAYGPLVVYASALARAASGSLVGEVLLCSVAWALALTLLFACVRRHARAASALLAAAAGCWLLARFYKWYLWLWPLAVLLALDRLLEDGIERRAERRRALVLGLCLGLAWLHRVDVGTLGAFAAAAVLSVHRPRRLPEVLAAAALPLFAWLGYLLVARGPDGVASFVVSTVAGGWMAKSGMGTGWPRFDGLLPPGPGTSRLLAYGLLALAIAGWSLAHLRARRAERGDARSRFLFAAALLSAASLHQALHRKDGQHLLQVLAPALAGGFVWLEAGLTAPSSGRRPRATRLARVALVLAAVLSGFGLGRFGRVDLVAPSTAPAWTRLDDPLRGRNPLLAPLRALREHAAADEAILVFPLWPQAYVLAERRMSGMLHGYYPGVFDRPPWSERNLRAIEADPPAAVLVSADFLGRDGPLAERNTRFRRSHGALDAWLRERYTRVLFDDGRMLVLGPAPGAGERGS